MNLIVAVDENWGIGKDGKLLFSIKQDMKFFRDTTMGSVLIMGRKTLDSFPGGKPLPKRVNIVLTHNKDFQRDGVIACHSVEEVLKKVNEFPLQKVFIIGGEQIYRQFLPYCEVAYITKVDSVKNADSYMENLDNNEQWINTHSTKDFADSDISYRFCVYKHVNREDDYNRL